MVKDADVSVHQYIALGWKATPLYTHPYDPAAIQAAGFASVEDLLAAWQVAKQQHTELIMGVVRKYPNETRHQTALRYIHKAEEPSTSKDAAITAAPAPENK